MSTRMLKTVVKLLLFGLLCGCTGACSGAEQKAGEVYDLAVFEEQQFNVRHARELYEQIVEIYPETKSAQQSLRALRRLRNADRPPT